MPSVKYLMNGAKIPNWAKLVALGLSMGWVAAIHWQGVKATQSAVETTVHAEVDSLRDVIVAKAQLDAARADITNVRLENVEQRLERLELRIDYRYHQTSNQIEDVQDDIKAKGKR